MIAGDPFPELSIGTEPTQLEPRPGRQEKGVSGRKAASGRAWPVLPGETAQSGRPLRRGSPLPL